MDYYDILLAKKLNGGGGGGITPEIKTALLGCFSKVAWVDEHGQDYYNTLESALYQTASLSSISAVYTQSGTVYTNTSLDDLKTDLVVTASWSDSSTSTVDSNYYTLSGTLTVGTSTITVTYLEKATTFSVTVTEDTGVADGTYTPTDVIRGQYIDANGDVQTATNNSGYFGDYIPLGSNTYNLVLTNPNARTDHINWRLSEYDSNKTFIKQTQYSYSQSNITTTVFTPSDSNTKFIRLGWYDQDSTSYQPIFSFLKCTDLPMEIGNIDGTTGQDSSSTNRIRSDYMEASGTMTVSGMPFTFEQYDGYLFRCYDSSKAFVGSLTNSGNVFTGDISNVSLPTNTAYVRLLVGRSTAYSFSTGWGTMIDHSMSINGTAYRLVEAS